MHVVHGFSRGTDLGSADGSGSAPEALEIGSGLELQLQRGIARLPGTPARPIVTQSGRHLASPRIRILRRLQFGRLRLRPVPDSVLTLPGCSPSPLSESVFYYESGRCIFEPTNRSDPAGLSSRRGGLLEAGSKLLLAGIVRFRINQVG